MATTFQVVYQKVQKKLNDTTATTLDRVKLAINQIHWDMAANFYGITVTADLINDGDTVAIPDKWVYVLVQGSFSQVLEDNDDSRATNQRTVYQQLLAYMKSEYITVTGTVGTFQYLYTTLCKMVGFVSPADVQRAKDTINFTTIEICNRKDWDFLADRDNAIAGTGASNYSLAALTDIDRLLFVRVGETSTTASPMRRKDRMWIMDALASQTITEPPERYYSDGSTIQLDCSMSATYNLYIDYKKKVANMSLDADTCAIPNAWLNVVLQGSYAMVIRGLQNVTATQLTSEYGKYQASLAYMIRNLAQPYGEDVDETIQDEKALY